MYSWLYYKIYTFLKSKKNFDPTFNSAGLVFFSQGVHFLLIAVIVSKMIGCKLFRFSDDYTDNKIAFMPVAIVWLWLVHIYFERKLPFIKQKYPDKPINVLNLISLLIFIIIIPVVILMIIAGEKGI